MRLSPINYAHRIIQKCNALQLLGIFLAHTIWFSAGKHCFWNLWTLQHSRSSSNTVCDECCLRAFPPVSEQFNWSFFISTPLYCSEYLPKRFVENCVNMLVPMCCSCLAFHCDDEWDISVNCGWKVWSVGAWVDDIGADTVEPIFSRELLYLPPLS